MRRLMNADSQVAAHPEKWAIYSHLRRKTMKCSGSIFLLKSPRKISTRILAIIRLRPAGIAAFGLFLLVVSSIEAGIISTQQGRGTYILDEQPSAELSDALRAVSLDALARHYIEDAVQLGFSPEQAVEHLVQQANHSKDE